eukprot:m.235555 g.235555  ORF g.235555 m.235555 type:complete len:196 (-) comp33666_c1_seq1:468-1055(-)
MAVSTTAILWKEGVSATGLGIACGFNIFFITMNLLDLSADIWTARDTTRQPFIAAYYEWKGDAPLVGTLMLPLIVLLPLVVYGQLKQAFFTIFGWRRAHHLHHFVDIVQPITVIGVILPTIITILQPAVREVMTLCTSNSNSDDGTCTKSAALVLKINIAMLLLNLVMFGCDLARYSTGSGEDDEDKLEPKPKQE